MAELSSSLESSNSISVNSLLDTSLLIELAAEHFMNTSEPDALSLATLELSGYAELTPRLTSDVLFSYDEDSESIEFDTLVMNFQHEHYNQWLLAAGRDYLPFGAFITHQVNDTLALEFAEARQLFAGIAYENHGVVTELYIYQDEGGNEWEDDGKNENEAGQLGGSIVYQGHLHHLGLDYIGSLHGDEGVSIHGHINVKSFILIAERIMSLGNSQQIDQFELAYQFGTLFISAAYQTTHVIDAFELHAEKTSLTVHGDFNQYAQLGIELGRADDNESMKMRLSILL
jgi:hypothetical protein